MKSMIHACWILSSSLAVGMASAADDFVRSGQVDVMSELERLMSEHAFEVTGIEQTQDASGYLSADENLRARLNSLLEDFDHIIIQQPDGAIERVIILGEKVAYTPPDTLEKADGTGSEGEESGTDGANEIVLATSRKGSSHLVTLTLEGVGGQKAEEPLVIDTGADQVVLPVSLISRLGLSANALRNQSVQTANGPVEARLGKIPAIWLGETRIADVEVAFIDDQSLGGNALLGMSVLGRFRMTIDDEKNQLTLASK